MCEPITLIGLGLSAAGSIANGMAANDAAKARASALQAERYRQQGLQDQQTALAQQSQEGFQNMPEQIDARTQELTDYFMAPIGDDPNATAGMVAPEGTSSITVREMDRQSGAAKGRTDAQAASLAKMRSFGDLLGDKMRGVSRNSSAIDQLTGFRRGSTDAMAPELEAAAMAGAGKNTLGDILGGMGSIATGYGNMVGASDPANHRVTGWVNGANNKIKGWLGN